jgi:hypothetical protein
MTFTLVGRNSNTCGGAMGRPWGKWDLVGARGLEAEVTTVCAECYASAASSAAVRVGKSSSVSGSLSP